MVPPGITALPSAPTAIAVLVESNVPRLLEHPLSEQTSKVTLPESFVSGSANVAVNVGVAVSTIAPPAGETSGGGVGAASAVLFGMEPFPSVAVGAALPVRVAASRTIGSLPGFV